MKTLDSDIQSCVAELAVQLADPDVVLAHTTRINSEAGLRVRDSRLIWSPTSLGSGYPGISLFYSELSHHDDYYRAISDQYLKLAFAALQPDTTQGLYSGLTAVAFATRAASKNGQEYSTALLRLDDFIETYVHQVLAFEKSRRLAQAGPTSFSAYDVITGVAGIGRYLLSPGVRRPELLREVLAYLVELTEPVEYEGNLLPGWWVAHSSELGEKTGESHVNFGMSHGISGVLALLSLSWEAEERVAGQEEAIGRIVDWLLEQSVHDEFGMRWPATLSRSEYLSGHVVPARNRPSWCYGSPSIARALQLAGQAVAETSWQDRATVAVVAALSRLESHRDIEEPGLCHGWAGIMHTVGTMNRTLNLDTLATKRDEMLVRVLETRISDAPFSFRNNSNAGSNLDAPGFSEGAAGVALSLLAGSANHAPMTSWDQALLLT
ncbi:lanthionine synthetase C family protein [Streptomyces sp. H39-S7]|uniref:lanthionine synthetase C family protein n=1 Tax=Streptomyces sp. H39-S7 TaxID=3004357 RepID=UPI0022AF7FD7|nr:lanthionine synthetase C family protein [Streptomyces sp. H39-S7]MCZ4120033.1 lanthionine synthetase C family protein [Streptomyces sp. H39-S7]